MSWLPILPVLIPLLLNSWATPAADLASATPVSTLRADRRTCILYACAYTVVPGIPLGLAIAFLPSPVSPGDRPFLLLGWGLTTGALTWLLAWLVAGRAPLVALAHAVLFLKSGSRAALPRLLEDAAARQVLRQAGAGPLVVPLLGAYWTSRGRPVPTRLIPVLAEWADLDQREDGERSLPAPAHRLGADAVLEGACHGSALARVFRWIDDRRNRSRRAERG